LIYCFTVLVQLLFANPATGRTIEGAGDKPKSLNAYTTLL